MSNVKIQGNVSGTGSLTIAAPNTNTDRTLTLPDQTGALMATGGGPINVSTSAAADSMTLNASGNLGVGTTSPISKVDAVVNVSGGSDILTIQNQNTGANTTKYAGLKFKGNDAVGTSKDSAYIRAYPADQDFVGSYLSFFTRASDSVSERMRLDSSGNLLVGTTSDIGGQVGSLGNGRDAVVAQVTNNSNSPYLGKNASGSIIYILSGVGTIYAVNTTVQSVSDVRTKENIRDSEDGLQTVLGLKPRRFDFKNGFGGDRKNVLGFIAQEIEAIFPDAVDTMPAGSVKDEDHENPYKSVGPGALIPVLVKAIQEQQAIITQLQADVAALKGAA